MGGDILPHMFQHFALVVGHLRLPVSSQPVMPHRKAKPPSGSGEFLVCVGRMCSQKILAALDGLLDWQLRMLRRQGQRHGMRTPVTGFHPINLSQKFDLSNKAPPYHENAKRQ